MAAAHTAGAQTYQKFARHTSLLTYINPVLPYFNVNQIDLTPREEKSMDASFEVNDLIRLSTEGYKVHLGYSVFKLSFAHPLRAKGRTLGNIAVTSSPAQNRREPHRP